MPFRNSLAGNLSTQQLKGQQKGQKKTEPEHQSHQHVISTPIPSSVIQGDQASEFWKSFRDQTKFQLTLHLNRANIKLSSHTGVTRQTIEPYIVCFMENQRIETKQKSEILKSTLTPSWEKQMIFKDLMFEEVKLKLEMKSNSSMGINTLICSLEFNVKELLILASSNPPERNFHFKSHHAEGTINLGFSVDPPLLPSSLDGTNKNPMKSTYKGGVERFRHVESFSEMDQASSFPVKKKNISKRRRDIPHLSVNHGNSCLLFDCGIPNDDFDQGGGGGGGGRRKSSVSFFMNSSGGTGGAHHGNGGQTTMAL